MEILRKALMCPESGADFDRRGADINKKGADSDTGIMDSDTGIMDSETECADSEIKGADSDTGIMDSNTENAKSDTECAYSDTGMMDSDARGAVRETEGAGADKSALGWSPCRLIEVPEVVRREIMEQFGVTRMTLWRALHFASDSAVARRVRIFAMQKGGRVLNVTPEEETIHDSGAGMCQYFGNGALLDADKESGTVTVYDRTGRVAVRRTDVSLSELGELQRMAADL